MQRCLEILYLLFFHHSLSQTFSNVKKSFIRIVDADAAMRKEALGPEGVGGERHVALYRSDR
jgi:stress response protein SCP2